jgi:hypothetical protein
MKNLTQETLEEAAILERAAIKYRDSTTNKMGIEVIAFIKGAHWQQERMYSEAIKFGKWLDENIQQREYYPMSTMTMEELFEQFKKK